MLSEVTKSQKAAAAVKAEVQTVKERAEALVSVIARETAVAEGKLEAARPALEAAEMALQVLLHICSSFQEVVLLFQKPGKCATRLALFLSLLIIIFTLLNIIKCKLNTIK